MHYRSTLAAAMILTGLGARGASAAVWYVDSYSPGPEHNGKTWQTAVTTIPAAIAAAASGDEVWVAYGTYSGTIKLKAGVSVYAGFIGYEFFRNQRPGILGLTTTVATPGGTLPAVVGSGATPNTVFDGFTVNGSVTGVNCDGGSPTISHNVFTGCTSAISISAGSPVIKNNVITAGARTSQQPAGAIYFANGSPVIVNNTIAGNGCYAIYGSGAATIVNNIIANNAGAIGEAAVNQLKATVRNNCFYGNLAVGKSYFTLPADATANIQVDPKFAVYAYGNLHLAADSPCRDAGDDSVVGAGDTDIDFQPRIQGSHVDIGADESDGRTWTFTPTIVRVSPNGNDAHDGSTWALAKKTLQAGIGAVSTLGGDVWVQTGTYAAPGDAIQLPPYCYLYGGFAGTETALSQRDWGANPTLISGPRRELISVAGGYRCNAIDGFVLSGAMNDAVYCLGGSPFVRNNVFMRNSGSCVYCGFGNPLVTNNAFYDNSVSSGQDGLVSCGSGAVTVTGNAFVGNGNGVASTSGPAVSCEGNASCVVTDNLFDGNNVGTAAQSAAVYVQGTGAIGNNTFVNTRGLALSALAGTTVVNNIFAFNDTGLYNPVSTANQPAIRANCFYGNGKDYSSTDRTGTYANIRAYPLFADLFDGDYRLLATSPCVDAGDDSAVSPGDTDLSGKARIQGRHVDMGCYESSATSMVVHWSDVLRALKIAGGLLSATADDVTLMSPAPPRTVDVDSAVSANRHLSGK